jgi:hypothetical protein
MAYWKVRYFPGIPLSGKNRKPTDIHVSQPHPNLSLRRALHIYSVGSEVLKVTTMTTAFRDATSCGPKDKCQRSEESWCFHFKDRRWKQYVPPKRRCIYTGLHP